MKIKPGVQGLHLVNPWVILAAIIYDLIRDAFGLGEGTITSAMDSGDRIGAPRRVDSAHPHGMALDLRTTDLDPSEAAMVAKMLSQLCEGKVTVILEEDHIHLQLTGWRQVLARGPVDHTFGGQLGS